MTKVRRTREQQRQFETSLREILEEFQESGLSIEEFIKKKANEEVKE